MNNKKKSDLFWNWIVFLAAGALIGFLIIGIERAEAGDFSYGYKALVSPQIDGGDPSYSVGLSASKKIADSFSLYGNIVASGLLDLDLTGDDHILGTLEVKYHLENKKDVMVLSHREISVSGDGVITRTYGKGALTSLSISRNF